MSDGQPAPLIVSIIFYILGISTLLPWNFFITADSLWQYKLRNTTLPDWPPPSDTPRTWLQVSFTPILVIVSNVCCFSFMFFTSLIVKRVSEKIRMLTSMGGTLASMIVITILTLLDTDQWQTEFFTWTLVIVGLINLGEAVFQNSTIGLAGQFPSHCMVALFSGMSMAGVISSVAFIISLAVGGEDTPIVSGTVYFVIADLSLLITIGLYLHLRSQKYYKNNVVMSITSKIKEPEDQVNDKEICPPNMSSLDTIITNEDKGSRGSVRHYWKVTKQIWWMAFYNGFTLLVTLSIFPPVSTYVTSTAPSSTWTTYYFQPTITFLLFNVADLIGREVTRVIQWPAPKSYAFHILCLSRVIFIPLVLLCHGDNKSFPTLLDHDAYYIVINALFGFTNGYFCSLTVIYYPKMVSREDQELAGTIIGAVFGLMMSVGSALSPLFVMVWGPETE